MAVKLPGGLCFGREGVAKIKLTDESKDLTPLLETILKYVPAVNPELANQPLRLQPFNSPTIIF